MLVFHKVLPEKKMLETDSVMPQITFARNIEHIITDIHVDNTLRNIEVFFFGSKLKHNSNAHSIDNYT
jgi:hypothetical protein